MIITISDTLRRVNRLMDLLNELIKQKADLSAQDRPPRAARGGKNACH